MVLIARFATEKTIAKISGAKVFTESAKEVDRTQVDADGYLSA